MTDPVFRSIDAVTVPVPDLDAGIAFYADRLGHPLRWRNDEIVLVLVDLSKGRYETDAGGRVTGVRR